MRDASSKPERLHSLDALRGFDMFWIIGADALVRALDRMGDNPVTRFLSSQLSHVEWAGFHFYDLIFPLFVFIAGVSSVWSLTKETERHGRAGATRRVIRRGLRPSMGRSLGATLSRLWRARLWRLASIAACSSGRRRTGSIRMVSPIRAVAARTVSR